MKKSKKIGDPVGKSEDEVEATSLLAKLRGAEGVALVATLRDVFGDPYSIEVLPEEKIIEILERLDVEEIVRKAYSSYRPGVAGGVAQLNVVDGSLMGCSCFIGTEDARGLGYVDLYEIKQNISFDTDDLYDDTEISLCREKYADDYAEMRRNENIDIRERELDCLGYYAYEDIRSDPWWADVKEQIACIYGSCKLAKLDRNYFAVSDVKEVEKGEIGGRYFKFHEKQGNG